MAKCRLSGGELILVRSGANTGDCAVVPFSLSDSYAAYDLILNTSPELQSEFLNLFLAAGVGRLQLELVRGRAAQPHVNSEEVSVLQIPLPPLAKQRELVKAMEEARVAQREKLADADALIASLDSYCLDALGLTLPPVNTRNIFAVRQSTITGLRCDSQFHHPRYAKILAALDAAPYPKISLGELSSQIVGGATPTRGDTDLYADSGIRFLRILNVKPNEMDYSDMKYIQPHVHMGDLQRSQLAVDDVLMTITGRVGTAAVVPAEILPANINQHLVRLRLDPARCLPSYLAAYLNCPIGLMLSNRGVTGGTRIALDYETVRGLQIPLPPLKLQTTIAAEVRRRRESARALRIKAEADWSEAKRWFEEQLLGKV